MTQDALARLLALLAVALEAGRVQGKMVPVRADLLSALVRMTVEANTENMYVHDYHARIGDAERALDAALAKGMP